jgi:ribosomal protein S18 acetylase RimI-like enzyme
MAESLTFKIVSFGTEDYRKVLKLQEDILRRPLGLEFTEDEVKNDDQLIHVGGYVSDEVCTAAACMSEDGDCRLIRVATKLPCQGRGYGSLLLHHCETIASSRGFRKVFLFARDNAIPFYLKNGYSVEGEMFLKMGIPHQKMVKLLA